MNRTVACLAFMIIFNLLSGLSCSQRGNNDPALASPQNWIPPVFPGAVPDKEIQANMTAVANTPEALDETACLCFGFPVHDARFYAYRTDADMQEIIDFYSEKMAEEGWREVAIEDTVSPTSPQLVWQQGESGPLVAYLMVVPMEDGRTLIYLAVAESDTPQEIGASNNNSRFIVHVVTKYAPGME